MTSYFAKYAFLNDTGWAQDVLITCDEDGFIESLAPDCTDIPSEATRLSGFAVPSMANVHSHAFQRAMAGHAERAGHGGKDSFWTWRDLMYRFLDHLTPDDVENIASWLYIEMLKSGYSRVGEFHYLHNDASGASYDNPFEMSAAIFHAASKSGIGLTHLPALYRYAGFGEKEPEHGQRRFILTPETYKDLQDFCAQHKTQTHHHGLCFHSLRAVSKSDMEDILSLHTQGQPIHIHIAEQIPEVEASLAWSGQRPVEWLASHFQIDRHWTLIHATHMDESETNYLAKSGAHAGLCPTTEGNLGDGFFNLAPYNAANGSFCIGSDSHVSISPIEELRFLEYGQRLLHQQRSIIVKDGIASPGQYLYNHAARQGFASLGFKGGAIALGMACDLNVIEAQHPIFEGACEETRFDRWIFSGNVPLVTDVIVQGRHIIKDGHHEHEEECRKKYAQSLARIFSKI